MPPTTDPPATSFPRAETLRDGTTVTIRPIHLTDRSALDAFHERCSPRTHYLRFFSAQRHLLPKMLDRFVAVDHDRREAVVAVHDGGIIAVGRYDRLDQLSPASPGVAAEVAFVVEDRYQGRGIATMLLHELVVLARERGIDEFRAITLAENADMQHVFRHSGLPVTAKRRKDDPSVIEFVLAIRAE